MTENKKRGRPVVGDGFDKKAYDRQYSKDRRNRLRDESRKHKTNWKVTAPEVKG